MARVLRWRVLANRAFSVREADLILSGESLMKLITLMFEAKRPIIMCVCTAWVALNLLAQASIAMIGLTYSVDGGTDSTGIITQPGKVLASALDCYYDNSVCANNPDQAPEVSQNLAHSFGSIIRGQLGCPYDSDTDILDASQACYYFYKKKGVC